MDNLTYQFRIEYLTISFNKIRLIIMGLIKLFIELD